VKLQSNVVQKSLSALHKLVWQKFIVEVDEFITFWCQVPSVCYVPKIIKIGCFSRVIQQIKREAKGGRF